MDGLTVLAASSFLKDQMDTLLDRILIGVYLKSFNDGIDRHLYDRKFFIDLLYDPKTHHSDVNSSPKILFMVTH